jgi:hypothetical protein
MAEETGGELLKNANDLGGAFERLLDRTGLIYILAFQPVRVPETGKFHTLDVKVKNRSYKVSHRTGYYEAKKYTEMSPIEKKLAASSALAAAVPRSEIPTWVLAAPFPSEGGLSRVPVIVEVPGDRLLEKHEGPKLTLDLFVYVMDAKGETRDYLFQSIGFDLAKVAAPLRKAGLKYYGQLSLPPGEYTLRTLVRDNETGRFGVSISPLSVPDPASTSPFALPPIFLDKGEPWILVKGTSHEPGKAPSDYPFAIGGEAFIPAALADVQSGENTRICLIVYNFGEEGSPLLYTGRILGLDGRPHGKVELTLVKSSDREREGARKLLLQFKPAGLEAGRYALAVKLNDPKTGRSSESSFPFDVQ